MASFIAKKLVVLIIVVVCSYDVLPQNDDRWLIVDELGRASNDDLLAHVDKFQQIILNRNDVDALVVLYGPRTAQYLNQRRIEGCNLIRKHPQNILKFVFGPEEHEARIKFYLVARDANIRIDAPDYKLIDLRRPIELNSAFATDEFCPLHFDLDWYAHFMTANPSIRGKVVVDSSQKEFIRRISGYRKELEKLGISPSRIKFFRRHFIHERDEQWWLIPQAKK